MSRFVAYFRVSTAKQGASGLGLEAQRRAVQDYILSVGGELIEAFEEVESGKSDDRPELMKALELASLTGARLLIAKLDRLSRNVAFLATLMERGVKFIACDMPEANELTLHILASVAQAERKAISARTTAALQSIKDKIASDGVHISRRSGKAISRLGNPNGLSVSRPDLGVKRRQEKSLEFASKLKPMIEELRGQGLSFAQVAARLTERRIKTASGNEAWSPMAVKRISDA